MEKEIIRDFLENIISAIENIDGNCGSCIDDFNDEVNETLEKYGLKLERCCEDGKYYDNVIIKEIYSND